MRASYVLMVPLLGMLAIVQSVAGPRLTVMGVRPDLILLVVLGVSLLYGSRYGIVWAFVGGLWMDVLSGGPMGGSSLALMAAALVVGIAHDRLFYNNLLVPLLGTLLGSLLYSLVYLLILRATGHLMPLQSTLQAVVIPAALYNGVLMVLATPLWMRLGRAPEVEEGGVA